jgi:hypothetical protein
MVCRQRSCAWFIPCAGCSAGDSIGPVLGAVVFDRGGGLRAAFFLQTAINAVPLLLASLVIPVWKHASSCSSSDVRNGMGQLGSETNESSMSDQDVMLPVLIRDASGSSCCDSKLHTSAAPAAHWARKLQGQSYHPSHTKSTISSYIQSLPVILSSRHFKLLLFKNVWCL